MRRFKIFVIVLLLVLFSLNSSFAGIEDSKFVLDQLLKGKGKPDVALLVIDMQKEVVRNFDVDHDYLLSISKFQDELIEYSYSKKIPVINVIFPTEDRDGELSVLDSLKAVRHKTYYKRKDDAFTSDFFDPIAIENKPEIRDKYELYMTRVYSSSAEDGSEIISGELGDYLRSEGIKNVFLTGCFDSVCVKETAEGALREDFKVYSDRNLNLVTRFSEKKGKVVIISKEENEAFSDFRWGMLKDNYPDTLEVFSSEDSPLTRSRSRFSRLFRSIFPCIRS